MKRLDGEFPDRYFDEEIMAYIAMSKEYFIELCDQFPSPHLWKKEGGGWKLRHAVWHEEHLAAVEESLQALPSEEMVFYG